MSDTAPHPETSPAAPEAPPPAVCPIPLSSFPPAVQKNLDPKSPLPVRMMASKGLIMGSPRDVLTALFVLSFDPDAKVVENARVTAGKLQDKIAVGLRDDDLPAPVLVFFASVLKGQDQYLEFVVLNEATPDAAVADIATDCSEKVAEIIAGNQLRILREESIIRALVRNQNTRKSTVDGVLDFCVRSGVVIHDLPEYVEARRRILGEEPEVAKVLVEAEQHTAEAVIQEFGEALTTEDAVVDDGKRSTFTQRFMKMSVSQRIKLATLGNKEARTLCLRDSNKLVAMAAVTSPRLTDGEIVALTNSRTLHDDVMRYIVNNREWTKNYKIKYNLANNPKTPPGLALKFLQHLHPNDLKAVARNKNIAAMLQTQARMMLQKKDEKKG